MTDEPLSEVESHDAIESPGWETKIVCSCGERCASKFEFAQHQAAGRGVQLGALVAALRSARARPKYSGDWEEAEIALRDVLDADDALEVLQTLQGLGFASAAELERERTQNRGRPLLSPREIGFLRADGRMIELPDERNPGTWSPAAAHELDAIEKLGHARLIVARVSQ